MASWSVAPLRPVDVLMGPVPLDHPAVCRTQVQELIHGGVSSDAHFSWLYPIWSAARLMRSIKKPAAGDGGTSDLVTRIIAGADNSSLTGIAVKTRLANGDIVH